VAAECLRQLRDVDLLGRYGGEEFVAFLPGADLSRAQIVAERLRDSIAHLPVQTGRGTTNVTVSIGIAETKDGSLSLESLVQHADEVMYQAKSLGRNRYEIWEDHSNLTMPSEPHQLERRKGSTPSLHSRSFEPLDRLEAFKISSSRFIEAVETESILGWVRALELRENEEERHAQNGADLTIHLCRHLGFMESELIHIYRGAMLHDIGKLAIPDHIHNKEGPLDEKEWEIMRRHVELGYQMLLPVAFLHPALAIPYCHHEKWDGSGYPRQLKGLEIPIEARLFTLVDVWQALRADRCYRPAWAEERIVEYIHTQSGHHFDPDLIDLFLNTVLKK
jgi:HD-GYP domain-containing protein (c-di-GMP phosphodiesterase class II)